MSFDFYTRALQGGTSLCRRNIKQFHKWTGAITCISAFLTVVVSAVYRMLISGRAVGGVGFTLCCLWVFRIIAFVFGALFIALDLAYKEKTRRSLGQKQRRQMKIYFWVSTAAIVMISLLNMFAKSVGKVNAEQLYYSIMADKDGMDSTVITSVLFPAFTLIIIRMCFLVLSYFSAVRLMERHDITKSTIPKTAICHGVAMLCAALTVFFYYVPVVDFAKYNYTHSSYIGDAYTDPRDVEVVFPVEKRNLIYIYLESMESTYASKENGGLFDGVGLIPEIERLAADNINVSNSDKLGGAVEGMGMSWTSAGMVASLYGLPLKCVNNKTIKGNSKIFSKTVGLLDVLNENGYRSAVVMGSSASFGGIDSIWRGADIYDYDYFVDKDMLKDKKVGWGMYDHRVYEYGTEIISNMAKGDQPFYVALNTIDTHYPDGYVCEYCPKGGKDTYQRSISCASAQVSGFVEWCKSQEWYSNTTIIIAGDHLTMKNDFYQRGIHKSDRKILNVIINPAPDLEVKSDRLVNRSFCSADMFPTTLAAIGCKVEGNRLGLGTNLFSDEQTDYEKHGVDFVNEQLSARSLFYEELIQGS